MHPELRQDFPALRSLDATPNNLPQQVTSFIGRERELAEIRRALEKSRLVTLLGAGGIGKTRMSLQAAADVMDDYPDGVWLVELAPVADAAAGAAGDRVGPRRQGGNRAPGPRCAGEGRQRPPAASHPRQLRAPAAGVRGNRAACCLQAGPEMKILATSREPLHVAGEATYPLAGARDAGSAAEPSHRLP